MEAFGRVGALLLLIAVFQGAVLSVTVEVTPKEAVVTVGQNVSMLCRVSVPIQYCRFEVPGLAASLNLNPLRSPSPPSYAAYLGDGLDKGHCGITIPRVEDLYNGPFKCAVGVATEGHESFATMQVIVARAPKLPPHMEVTRSRDPQDSYHEGERIQASCIVPDGRPVANITWFMGEDMLTEEVQRPEVIENPKDNLFTIIQNLTRTVRWSDNGKELRCVANHPVIGSDTTRTTARKRINVKFSPKPSDSDLEQFGFIEGEEGVITVRIKANPKPSFVWTVGNENIDEGNVDNSGHYEVGFAEAKDAGEWETKLHIRQVNKEDVEREYRIQATNSIGQQDYVVRISTSSQPRAMAEMGAGAIIGIVVAVLLVVLIIFIVVFARATGRWCFAGGAASRHTGETGGDPEDPGKREEAKRLTSKSRISTSVNNEQLLSQSSDTESADQGPAQKKQNIIKKKMPLVDFFKKAKDKVAGDTEILKDADAEKVAQQATHAVPEGEPKEVVYAELTHEQQVNQPTGVRVPVDKTEYSEILPINKDGKKPEK